VNRPDGEMTNGGFETIRSKVSPPAGSNRLPWRVSTWVSPDRAMVSAVKCSARGLTSVATTWAL
jgi:hypothetical protein